MCDEFTAKRVGSRFTALKALILDQAYVARELAELEAEWLALQEQLETSSS